MTAAVGVAYRTMLGVAVALSVQAVAGAPAPAAAQEVTLDAVDSLISGGRTDEARAVLTRWLDRSGGDASRSDRQRSLWLRAILTVDPAQAALDLQRLAVEFPGGEWSGRALLRLGQYAAARGDVPAARRYFGSVISDHPGTSVALEARSWLDRLPVSPADPDGAGGSGVGATTSAGGEATREDPGDPVDGAFTVQVGAFASEERARGLVDALREAGFSPRLVVVPGSDLVRVRVGRFADPARAAVLRERVSEGGFDAVVVADARREVPRG